MNHFAVHLTLTQHCKSTTLQYKIKIKLKIKKHITHFFIARVFSPLYVYICASIYVYMNVFIYTDTFPCQ